MKEDEGELWVDFDSYYIFILIPRVCVLPFYHNYLWGTTLTVIIITTCKNRNGSSFLIRAYLSITLQSFAFV